MAENTLITALEEDARAQAARLLEEAREATDAVLRESRADVERERDRRVRQVEIDLLGQRAALLNSARTRASGGKLSVRHGLIERAMDEAVNRFTSMPKDEYRLLLNRLFLELKDEWEKKRPGESPDVLVNPADIGLLETSFTLKADKGISLGVVFASLDGTVRFENTIPGRLEKGRTLMVPAINEMLFGGVFP
jgi:vacuolar-type H+-ATPase subunit E/Vma4